MEPEQIPLQECPEKTYFLKAFGGEKTCMITREKFSKFIETDTKFFNDRLFTMMDQRNRGHVNFQDFMNFVERYRDQSKEKKVEFLFNLYDVNSDGMLDKDELDGMLKSNMLENGLSLTQADCDLLISTLLEEALGIENAKKRNASLNLNDFLELFKNHVELLDNISTVIEKWIQPADRRNTKQSHGNKPVTCKTCINWTSNNFCFVFWQGLYFLVNIVLFSVKIWLFCNDEATKGASIYLAVARGCGWCLDFNGGFILVAMMRHFLTRLRSTWLVHFLPIDQHRYFHELAGIFIVGFSVIHMIMHLLNVFFTLKEQEAGTSKWAYHEYLFVMGATKSLGLLPGFAYISGFVLIFVLFVMVLGALPYVRNNGGFHVFYISHRICYPLFFTFLILHCKNFWKWFVGPGTIFIIEQLIRQYYKSFGFKTLVTVGVPLPPRITNLVIKRPPNFKFSPGDYLFINIPRFSKYEWHAFTISSAPENWDELTLHINAVGPWTTAVYEYFDWIKKNANLTISAPLQQNAAASFKFKRSSAHSIKSILGMKLFTKKNSAVLPPPANFTKADYQHLRKRPFSVSLVGGEEAPAHLDDVIISNAARDAPAFQPSQNHDSNASILEATANGATVYGETLTAYLDGPYGAPSSQIFSSEHAVLVGGGIGVTPFASILQSIMYRHWNTKLTCPNCNYKFSHGFHSEVNRLKKVDFFWINRDQKAFDWFVTLLSKLEIEQQQLGGELERFLDVHMYITKALKRTDMKAVALQLALELSYDRHERDLLMGLMNRMNAGRPNWENVFRDLNANKKGNVTVFFCGPHQLGSQLNKLCVQYGFSFKTEVF